MDSELTNLYIILGLYGQEDCDGNSRFLAKKLMRIDCANHLVAILHWVNSVAFEISKMLFLLHLSTTFLSQKP